MQATGAGEAQPGWPVTAAVMGIAAMTIMANATIASSLPGLRAHYAEVPGIDTLAGLIVTLPSASIVLTAGLVGWLADRFDRQVLLAVAALFYAAGGMAGLWAESLTAILAGRIVLGIGVAGTMTLAMAWAADLWQGPARARFMGMQGAAISAGGIVFMLLGGAMALLHWRGAFAVYGLVLPVAAFALWALAPEARSIRTRRAAARAGGTVPQAGDGTFPWGAYLFVGPLAFLFMVAFYVTPTRLPFLLEDLGVSNTLAVGAIMAVLTLVSMPVALLYGHIRRHVSAFGVFAWSFALMGAALLAHSQATGWQGVLLGSVLAGLAMGPSMANYTTWFMARVPATQRGRAAGMLTTAFFLGQFASPLVSAPLVATFGLQGAFAVLGLGLVAIAGGVAAAGTMRRDPVAA
ncbi:MAG: MFS transporter [Paracoccaceae bacterium]|nr:MAG: MFS transporter [Paracoccaceae bacterium]